MSPYSNLPFRECACGMIYEMATPYPDKRDWADYYDPITFLPVEKCSRCNAELLYISDTAPRDTMSTKKEASTSYKTYSKYNYSYGYTPDERWWEDSAYYDNYWDKKPIAKEGVTATLSRKRIYHEPA